MRAKVRNDRSPARPRSWPDTPESELKELALIYQAKGLSKAQAQAMANEMMKNPKVALDTLVREELGINPNDLGGNPWSAAVVSFVLFALGAIVSDLAVLFQTGSAALALDLGECRCGA